MARYWVFSTDLAGLTFALKARQRGHDVVLAYDVNGQLAATAPSLSDIETFPVARVGDDAVLSAVQAFEPDFLVSCIYGQLIPPPVIAAAKQLAVNIHPGRLPDIRSGNAYFWNVILEREHWSVTVHLLNDDWDCGDILFEEKIPMAPWATQRWLAYALPQYMAERAEAIQLRLEAQDYTVTEQTLGRYYPKPSDQPLSPTFSETVQQWYSLVRACNGVKWVKLAYGDHLFGLTEVHPTTTPSEAAPGTIRLTELGEVMMATADFDLELTVLWCDRLGSMSARVFVEAFYDPDIPGFRSVPGERPYYI